MMFLKKLNKIKKVLVLTRTFYFSHHIKLFNPQTPITGGSKSWILGGVNVYSIKLKNNITRKIIDTNSALYDFLDFNVLYVTHPPNIIEIIKVAIFSQAKFVPIIPVYV